MLRTATTTEAHLTFRLIEGEGFDFHCYLPPQEPLRSNVLSLPEALDKAGKAWEEEQRAEGK